MDETNSTLNVDSDVLTQESIDAIDAEWDDISTDMEDSDDTDQYDEEETTEEETDEEQQEQGTETEETEQKADEQFELKYLGEMKTVSREEITALAQKGMDYDRIRAERDALKAEKENGNEFEQFVRALAEASGKDVDAMMEERRVMMLRQKNPEMSLDEAKTKVREGVAERKAESEAKAKRQESFIRFAQEHPNVPADSIPKEVWDDVNAGKGDLNVAYAAYEQRENAKKLAEENKALQEKIAAMEANAKNAARSTGSRKSRGAKAPMSELDKFWYSD